jgi:ABC-type nickel/cobalt efflux system permease component RcnA
MQQLLDTVMSAQRQFQGLLAGHMLNLFGSVDRVTLGMAVAVALDLIHALTPGHGKAVIFSHSHARLRDDSPVSLDVPLLARRKPDAVRGMALSH